MASIVWRLRDVDNARVSGKLRRAGETGKEQRRDQML